MATEVETISAGEILEILSWEKYPSEFQKHELSLTIVVLQEIIYEKRIPQS